MYILGGPLKCRQPNFVTLLTSSNIDRCQNSFTDTLSSTYVINKLLKIFKDPTTLQMYHYTTL